MPILFNGSSGYLELAAKIVSSFPCTIAIRSSNNGSGTGQFWAAQAQSNNDRMIAAWLDANGVSKYGYVRNPGNTGGATKGTDANDPNATLRWAVAVFAAVNSFTMYYGSATGATDTTTMVDDLTNHDRVTVGAYHYNGNSPSLFCNGSLEELHFYSGALSSGNVTTLLGLSTLPETLPNWVDGWSLKDVSSLTSLGGTRTLTAVGGVSTSGLAAAYTRSGGATFGRPYYNHLIGGNPNV